MGIATVPLYSLICKVSVICSPEEIEAWAQSGTPAPVNGCDGVILFDPMTHTLNGSVTLFFNQFSWLICLDFSDSGIGDFGTEGINTFIESHKCGAICKRLGLDEGIPLVLLSARKGSGLGEPHGKDTPDKMGDSSDNDSDNDNEDTQNID